MASGSEGNGSKRFVKFGNIKSKKSSGRKSGVVKEQTPTHGSLSGASQDQPTTNGQGFDEDEDPFDELSELERLNLDEETIEKQAEEEREGQEAGGPCTSNRKSVVRACDFCHKQYIAIIYGNQHIESIPSGSAERICDGCIFKPRKKLKVQLREEMYDRFARTPGDDDYDDASDDMPRPVTSVFNDISRSLDALSLEVERERYFERKIASILRRYESSDNLSLSSEWFFPYTPPLRNFAAPDDEASTSTRLSRLTDCYTTTGVNPGRYGPCERHKAGDPRCWLYKDFEDIPEASYKRYWRRHMRARQDSEKFEKFDLPRRRKKAMLKGIYRPKKCYSPDKEITRIGEDEGWTRSPSKDIMQRMCLRPRPQKLFQKKPKDKLKR